MARDHRDVIGAAVLLIVALGFAAAAVIAPIWFVLRLMLAGWSVAALFFAAIAWRQA
jgi:hypothetical protein